MANTTRGAIVGVTGKYCAGKSTVSAALDARGFVELDADAFAHVALEHRRDEVVALFGNDVLRPDGSVDRKALGQSVFADAERRRQLEELLHPPVARMIERQVAERSGPIVINAVFLVRAGFHRLCDVVLWVAAPWWLRLSRGTRRDGVSVRSALRVMAAQKTPRRGSAHAQHPWVVTIRSGSGLASMDQQVGRVLAAVWQKRE